MENKSDLEYGLKACEKLDKNELKQLTDGLGTIVLKISAKTTEGVDELFQCIGIRYLEKIKKENPEKLNEEEKEEEEEEENEGKENSNEEDKKSKCFLCLG